MFSCPKESVFILLPSMSRTLFLMCFCFASVCAQTDLFEKMELSAWAGVNHPTGTLSEVLDPQPTFAFFLSTPYYHTFWCTVGSQYTWLFGPEAPRDLHFIKLSAGLEWRPESGLTVKKITPALGVSLSSYTIRATFRGRSDKLLLDEFESEFGAHSFLGFAILSFEKFAIKVRADWDVIFSQPAYSHFVSYQVGGVWQLW